MNWTANQRVGARLLLLFCVAAVAAGALGAYGYATLSHAGTAAQSAAQPLLLCTVLASGICLALGAFAYKTIGQPIAELSTLAEGQTAEPATGDEITTLRAALVGTQGSARLLADHAARIRESAEAGDLDARIDPTLLQGPHAAAAAEINSIVDAISGHLSLATSLVERIGHGDIPEELPIEGTGAYVNMRVALNRCIHSVNALVADAHHFAEGGTEGRLNTQADASAHEGAYRTVVEALNGAFASIALPLGRAIEHLERLSKGINGKPITNKYKGDLQRLADGFTNVFAAVDRLVEDSVMLAASASEGRLDVRADATRHEGDFRRIVEGTNTAFETIAVPLGKAIEHLSRLSKGINGKPITTQYKGELQRLAEGFSTVFAAIDRLIADSTMLAESAQEGRLDVRADATKHEGDFRRIVEGINTSFETIALPLGKAIEHLDRLSRGINGKQINSKYKGELQRLADGFNVVFASIDRLISDSKVLAAAAQEGKLNVRADASQHEGDFRAIIDGVNRTLDAVIGPLHVAAEYVDQIAVGKIPPVITDTYHGDFNEIKNNLNSMIAYLTEMAQLAEAISTGDLTHSVVPRNAQDALGVAFERMVRELSQLIAQTHAASNEIANSSQEVAQGNEDLSERTSEQASSLEETASSMEEMTSTVKQNADNATQAKSLAVQARDVAESGGEVVQHAVNSMSAINTASRRITDIISVIDEIAFQTNLLALNAAVEAARVGEQGRGFAVVAAEVRNLAQRSATAAKEIKALVQDSVTKVQEGTDLVNESGERLHDIVTSVKKVTDIVSEIAAASLEQSAGIEQVNKAVMQMDQITQQNAALVEEATAASQSMSEKARNLQGLVSRFKLDTQYMESVARSAAAAKAANAPARALKATGTDGPVSRKSARKPDLKVSTSDDGFDDF